MPLTKEEIKFQHQVRSKQERDSWVSPNFGDGGWHNTPGCEAFDPETCVLLADRVLVEYLPMMYNGVIYLCDDYNKSTRLVKVLKIGPGKRDPEDLRLRLPMFVRPGDIGFMGPYFDWQSQDEQYAIIQEADIRALKDMKESPVEVTYYGGNVRSCKEKSTKVGARRTV